MRMDFTGKIRFTILFVSLICVKRISFAQQENTQGDLTFNGNMLVTQNGISLIPSFSLGDPALQFDLKLRKNRFSFEPDMRFALEGKPWSFIFWFRYQLIKKERFSLRVGAHPALNFRTVTIIRNGLNEDLIETRRYLAGEIAPNFKISDKVSVGVYYLRAKGFDEGIKSTNFATASASFRDLFVTEKFYFNFSPLFYFLKTDDLTGIYANAFIELKRKDFPLSIASILNKAIETEIVPEDDFIWNIMLVYTFR